MVQWQPQGIEKAISAWERAIAVDPTFVPAFVARAEWFILYNKGDEAIRLLQPVVVANPGEIDALVMIGRAYASIGAFDQALRSFDAALKLEPQNFKALSESGQVFEMIGDYAAAAKIYEKAGAIYDPSAVPETGHGIENPYLAAARNYDRSGDVAKALSLITLVIQEDLRNSFNFSVLEERASYFEKLGQESIAIADLTLALENAPPNEQTHLLFKRAVLYQRQGKEQLAGEDFSKALGSGDRQAILRMQVYLRNQGFAEVEINGMTSSGLLKSISTCLAAVKCAAGLGKPI